LASNVPINSHIQLKDCKGVVPDVIVEPAPGFFIGFSDDALEAAVRILTQCGDRSSGGKPLGAVDAPARDL
jgi:hypothetical protein